MTSLFEGGKKQRNSTAKKTSHKVSHSRKAKKHSKRASRRNKKGGIFNEILVPAGLVMANQLMKNRINKKKCKTTHKKLSKRRRTK